MTQAIENTEHIIDTYKSPLQPYLNTEANQGEGSCEAGSLLLKSQ